MYKLKILTIDDEALTLKIMNSILSEYGECHSAKSVSEAIHQVKTSINTGKYFDLITIDIGLPDGDGINLLYDIHEIEKITSIKAVKFMVTAEGTTDNVVRAMERRCDDFIVKPVDKELIHQKLIKHGLIFDKL